MTAGQHEQREGNLPAGLAKPAQRALAAAGYRWLEQLAGVREAQLKELHGIGPRALAQLRDALRAEGLSFAAGTGAGDEAEPQR
jgi:hypothetical protein